uniref:Uncharacterized protein n=1 Tax=Gopherus evgoodei TaxID=1825980 RepID=A0A8C4Y148_9SAUR
RGITWRITASTPNPALPPAFIMYEPAKCVATPVKSMDYDSAVSTGFMKLFNYIQGMKIEMTAPVTFHVEPGAGPFSKLWLPPCGSQLMNNMVHAHALLNE